MNELKQRIAELCPDIEGQDDFCAVLEALCSMYSQYCSEDGHMFMSAVEEASDVLEYYGCLKPDLAGRGEIRFPENCSRPITLAVVLRAMEKMNMIASCDTHGNIGVSPFKGHVYWNLSEDRLEDQTPECIAFLKSILGV